MLSQASGAIITVAASGRISEWGPDAELMSGWPSTAAVGQLFVSFVDAPHEEECRLLHALAPPALTEASPTTFRTEIALRRKTASPIPIEMQLIAIRSATPPFFLAILRDLSSLQTTLAVERMLATLVEASEDAIITKTLEGMITSWNPAAERIFGYTAGEIVGQSDSVVTHAPSAEQEDASLDRVRRGERVDDLQSRRYRKDGSAIDLAITSFPVWNVEGRVVRVCTIARDVLVRDPRRSQVSRAS